MSNDTTLTNATVSYPQNENEKKLGDNSEVTNAPPMHRAENNLKTGFWTADEVAKILGVNKSTVTRWRQAKIFNEDILDHHGVYWYSKVRVEQLKSVYHKGWNKIYKNDVRTMSAGQNVNPSSQKNTLMEILPTEISCLKRFIPVQKDGKKPRSEEWQMPETQKYLSEIFTINAAFFIGVGDMEKFLVLDFDHVLNDNGDFENTDAQDFYKNLRAVFPQIYCEKSVSGHGLHCLLRPSDGVFEVINKKLFFDKDKKSCVEVFYGFKKTITLTGNLYNCASKTEIPTGEIVDDFVTELLQKISVKQGKKKFRRNSDFSFVDSDEYEKARALAMLDCIQISQLDDYYDWLSVMTSCKNLGIDYQIVDSKNAQDTEHYNEKENQKTWLSISNVSIGMANLHAKAKRFGYVDRDFFNEWRKNHADHAESFYADFEEKNNQQTTTKAVIADCPIDLLLPFPSVYRFTADGILRYVSKIGKFVPCCHTPVVVTERLILQPSNKVQ